MPADMHYKHELGWQCENFRSLRLLLGLGSFLGLLLVCGCLLLCGCLLGFLLAGGGGGWLVCSWLVFGERSEAQAHGHHGSEQQGEQLLHLNPSLRESFGQPHGLGGRSM